MKDVKFPNLDLKHMQPERNGMPMMQDLCCIEEKQKRPNQLKIQDHSFLQDIDLKLILIQDYMVAIFLPKKIYCNFEMFIKKLQKSEDEQIQKYLKNLFQVLFASLEQAIDELQNLNQALHQKVFDTALKIIVKLL